MPGLLIIREIRIKLPTSLSSMYTPCTPNCQQLSHGCRHITDENIKWAAKQLTSCLNINYRVTIWTRNSIPRNEIRSI